jgi:hypothetical protein
MKVNTEKTSRRGLREPVTPKASEVVSVEPRLAEIAEILADGLMRLRARKSSGLLPGEADFSVETLARQSGAVAEPEGDSR